MLLQFTNGTKFAIGDTNFYSPPESDELSKARITVPVRIGGFTTSAIVDTGQLYMVVSPELTEFIVLEPVNRRISPTEILVEGKRVEGMLHRVALTLLNADRDGADLPLSVLAFVPNKAKYSGAQIPSFLGLTSCLDAIRFAIDANSEVFYFG
ncbi:MAG TPA: hypothetical protein VF708_08230 [Pyrinomonadaceae bacterium]|jgi:hypothetical protein